MSAGAKGAAGTAGAGRAPGARWWLVIPPLLLFWMVGNVDKLGISVVVTNQGFLRDMGLVGKPAAIGFLLTAFTFVYAVFNFVWGFAVDRLGPRRVAVAGGILWGAMMILSGLSTSYGMLLVSRMLLGVAEAVLWTVSTKLTANWFHHDEKGRAQSFWWVGNTLGPALGAPLIVAVMLSSGWRAAFFVLAGLSLVLVVPLFLLLARDRPEQHRLVGPAELAHIQAGRRAQATMAETNGGETYRRVLGSWRFWVVTFAGTGFGFIFFGVAFWLPTYLRTARHFSPAAMGGWTSVSWIIAVGMALLAGWIVDRSRQAAAVAGVSGLLAAAFLIVAAVTGSAPLAAACLGFGLGSQQMGSVAQLAVYHQLAGPEAMGRAVGTISAISSVLGGLAPTIIGLLVAATGGSFVTGILFLALCALAAAGAMFVLVPAERRAERRAVQPAPATT